MADRCKVVESLGIETACACKSEEIEFRINIELITKK